MNIRVDRMITEVVEQLLPRMTQGKLLRITLEVSYVYDRFEGSEPQFAQRKFLHFIFSRESNYTQVFYLCNKSFALCPREVFELQVSHDSCWSTDGFKEMYKLHRKTMNEASVLIGDEYQEKFFQCTVSIHSLKVVDGGWTRDYGHEYKYRYFEYFENDKVVILKQIQNME